MGPMRSIHPVNWGRAVKLAIAGALGLVLGLFAVFIAEFAARVRVVVAQRRAMAARESNALDG